MPKKVTLAFDIVRASRRAIRALLSMTDFTDGIKKDVILRRPQSGRLEGRTRLVPSAKAADA
jgi:hypothetical protein